MIPALLLLAVRRWWWKLTMPSPPDFILLAEWQPWQTFDQWREQNEYDRVAYRKALAAWRAREPR